MFRFLEAKVEFCNNRFWFFDVYEEKKKIFLEFLTFNYKFLL